MAVEEKDSNRARVLIVDYVETNRFILEMIIEDMGLAAFQAENGAQAIKCLPECRPHLILSDISMPELDGYELCRIVKADARTRDIPIIFISAFDGMEDIIKGFELGGADYITKPFIPEVVKARVGAHLHLYEVNQMLAETNRRLQASVKEQIRQLEQEKKNVLYAMARAAGKNSSYGTEHIARLSSNCRLLSQSMQLSPLFEQQISDTYIDTIELAAPLCDVGNIAIPSGIFGKRGVFTPEERRIMETHALTGAELLSDIVAGNDYNDFMQMSVDIARSHHENWDGSGYPQGLKGAEIPLAAQIVAVVSVYNGLTEKRPHRDAYSASEAFAIMQEDAGVKFNPDIFQIYCKISRQLC